MTNDKNQIDDVVIVYDKKGKYFQTWVSGGWTQDPENHGAKVAGQIGGSCIVVRGGEKVEKMPEDLIK